MASAVPMSRSRGSLSGLALLLLGAWGGLAPFIGPYFHLGFQPDKTWSYDAGRLYLVIVPAAVVMVCGLIVMVTRSRWLGGSAGLLAALGGLWFALGRTVMLFIGTTTTGSYLRSLVTPIAHSARGIIVTEVVTFTGLGLLIVFFGALAAGRVSIGAYRDFVRLGDTAAGASVGGAAAGGLASVGLGPTSPSYGSASPSYGSASPSYGSASPSYTPYQPTSVSPWPPAEEPVVGGPAKFPSQYPTTGEDTVAQPGASTSTFTPGQVTYSPGQTKYPPTAAQDPTNPLTAPTQEQNIPPGQ